MAVENNDANNGEETGDTSGDSEVSSPSLEDAFENTFDDEESDSENSYVEADEDLNPGAGNESDLDGENTGASEGAEQNTSDDLNQKPFHEHPRFQELNNGLKQAKSELEAANRRLAEIDAREAAKAEVEAAEKYAAENPELDDEDLSDMIINDPKKYEKYLEKKIMDNMANAAKEKDMAARTQTQQQQNRTNTERARYEAFFSGEEEAQLVVPMLEDGSMEKYLKEHPGSDPIHAYHALSAETRKARILQAGRKEWETNLRSKGNASGASGAGGARPITKTNTNTKGGRASLEEFF